MDHIPEARNSLHVSLESKLKQVPLIGSICTFTSFSRLLQFCWLPTLQLFSRMKLFELCCSFCLVAQGRQQQVAVFDADNTKRMKHICIPCCNQQLVQSYLLRRLDFAQKQAVILRNLLILRPFSLSFCLWCIFLNSVCLGGVIPEDCMAKGMIEFRFSSVKWALVWLMTWVWGGNLFSSQMCY